MAENLTVTDAEIKALCRYLPNDGFIASYLGIESERVGSVRAKRVRRDYRYKREDSGARHDELPARAVDRSPCPRCGVRRDIGCGHTAERLVA